LARDEHLRHEQVAPLEPGAHLLQGGDERVEQHRLGGEAELKPPVGEVEHGGAVAVERVAVEAAEDVLFVHNPPSGSRAVRATADASAAESSSASETSSAPISAIRPSSSRKVGAETEIAAITRPPRPRTGAATATRPGSSSSTATPYPVLRISANCAASRARSVIVCR